MEVRLQNVQGAIRQLNSSAIALTIDDGPHPTTTTRLLDILASHQAHATFFVLGQQVARYPELAEAIVNRGHDIANHSYSHANLSRKDAAGIDRELSQCQRAIANATGIIARMFRPPYGALSDLVIQRSWAHGLATVLWSVDPRDWARPGARAIVSAAVSAKQGDIILLHDIPGSIEGTAAALPTIIQTLAGNGMRLTSVTRARRLTLGPGSQ